AVLVTRPLPDGEATAADLRARGFKVVAAPMLRFEPFGFKDEADAGYGGIIVTSANAVRAVESQLAKGPLLKLPLFTVGDRTAAAGPLSRPRGPAGWRSRRWRCRNAASRPKSPKSSVRPARPRSRSRPGRTKMPYSRH